MEDDVVEHNSMEVPMNDAMDVQDPSETLTVETHDPRLQTKTADPNVQVDITDPSVNTGTLDPNLKSEIQDPGETLTITESESQSAEPESDTSFYGVLENLLREPAQDDTDSSTVNLQISDNAEDEYHNDNSQDANAQSRFGILDFQCEPLRYTGAWTEFFSSPGLENNFTKGCKWSPDGLCVLTNSADNCLRLFNLSQVFNSTENTDCSNLPEMIPALKIKESDTVYDFCWYPLMNSSDPSTCLLVSTSRLNPVHAWDAFSGTLRASYRAYNHVDEVVAAVCVAFDPFGTKLYCGFNKSIRVFDVSFPGRHCTEHFMKAQGQSGIISCIAVNPANSKQFAAGSYLRTVALYNEPKGKQEMFLEGQIGGVTQLMFSPDGTKLYSGARKDQHILCWDLRFPDKVLYTMQREVTTNQRIYFDIDKSGSYLISGGTDGIASVWDLTKSGDYTDEEVPILNPILNFQAQNDCVNGVSFNPIYPMFTTSAGQRKYREPVESENEIDDADMFTDKHITYDNSLCLWWAGNPGHFM